MGAGLRWMSWGWAIALAGAGCSDSGARPEATDGARPDAESRCVECDAAPTDARPRDAQDGSADATGPVADSGPWSGCTAGATRCAAELVVETCSEEGRWSASVCPFGYACEGDACVCAPGAVLGCAGPSDRAICGADGPVAEPCAAGEACDDGECVEVRCAHDNDCHNDTFCELAGRCVPYPGEPRGEANGACQRAILVEDFTPRVQCRW